MKSIFGIFFFMPGDLAWVTQRIQDKPSQPAFSQNDVPINLMYRRILVRRCVYTSKKLSRTTFPGPISFQRNSILA